MSVHGLDLSGSGLTTAREGASGGPIARAAAIPRKDLQYFLGCGTWDDGRVMAEVRRHLAEEVAYRKTWEIGLDLPRRSGPAVPHAWVVGDDECTVHRFHPGRG